MAEMLWLWRALLVAAGIGIVALTVILVRREQTSGQIDPATGHALQVGKVPKLSKTVVSRYLLAYCLFALVLALSVVAFITWQPAIVALMAAAGVSSDWSGAIYVTCLVLVGIILFSVVIVAEPYLRKGVEQSILGRRFAYLCAGLIGITVAGWLLRQGALFVLG